MTMKKLYNCIKYLKLLFFSVAFVISLRFSFFVTENTLKAVIIAASVSVSAATVLAIAFRKRKIGEAVIFIPLLSGILLGSLWGQHYNEGYVKPSLELNGRKGEITAVITGVDYESEYLTVYRAKLMSFEGESVEVRTVIELPSSCEADVNDLVSAQAELRSPSDVAKRGFNEKEYYRSDGIYVLCFTEDLNVIGIDRSVPAFFRSRSEDMSAKLRVALGENNGGFISALILGKKELIPDRMNTSFRYLGISHVLSVSGLHLAVLMAAVIFIASYLVPNKSLIVILSAVFAISFVILVGAPPSSVRSAVMILLTILELASGRVSRGIHLLAIAALVIAFLDPSLLNSASYLLSMGASLGIIVLGGPSCSSISKRILDRNGVIRSLGAMAMMVCITLSAVLFTLPVIIRFFGEISILSVPANLLFVPICTVLLYLSALLLLFYGTPLCPLFTYPVSYASSLIDKLTYSLSLKLPSPASLCYSFVTVAIVLTAAAFLLFIIFLPKKRLTCLLVATAVFSSTYLIGYCIYDSSHSADTSVICLNEGKNDYIMLNKGGKTLLIDVSDGSSSSLYYASTLSATKLYDSSIDTLLLTHLHRNHISAVSRLADKTRVKQIYVPFPKSKDEGYFATALERVAADRELELCYYEPSSDTTFDFSGCRITVFRQDRIERSVQPIHLIMLEDRKRLIYCGGAINESEELLSELKDLLGGETHVILGIHGPIIKKPFDLDGPFYSVTVLAPDVNSLYCTDFPTVNGAIKRFELK